MERHTWANGFAKGTLERGWSLAWGYRQVQQNSLGIRTGHRLHPRPSSKNIHLILFPSYETKKTDCRGILTFLLPRFLIAQLSLKRKSSTKQNLLSFKGTWYIYICLLCIFLCHSLPLFFDNCISIFVSCSCFGKLLLIEFLKDKSTTYLSDPERP